MSWSDCAGYGCRSASVYELRVGDGRSVRDVNDPWSKNSGCWENVKWSWAAGVEC